MDITKRFDRILQLFFILQSKSFVGIEELEKRFEVSRRTIYRDLQALEVAGIPLNYDPGKGHSIVEGYRLQPSRFTQEEVLSLSIAEKIMQQHETQFIKQHFEAALIKIKSSFQSQQKKVLNHLEDKLHINSGLNTDDYLPNVIDVLLNATISSTVVNLSYIKSNENKANNRKVEPVGLFYESNFWYLLGFCHLRKDYRNFRLDRIKLVNLLDEHFTQAHLPVDQLRSKGRPETITKIIIAADRETAHYLFWERQDFGFVREEITADHVMMYFDCEVHPTAFVRWFMKFADVGEIIEPDHLKIELKSTLNAGSMRANRNK